MFYPQHPSCCYILLLILFSALPSFTLPTHEHDISYISTPLPPSQDPWYTAPLAYEFAPPGTILRLRHAPGNLTFIVGNCSAAYNILYRTTNSLYEPAWAVTTLYVPLTSHEPSPNFEYGTALLSYQFPYNTDNVDHSPSYSFYNEDSADLSDISNSLGRNWFVTVPDFEGPLGSNVAGILEGHAVLDSLRACLSSNLGLSPTSTRYALWGYSGGSIASEWALELQEQYAPELNISGAALGGTVPNLTHTFEVVGQGTIWAYMPVSGMLGMLNQYPDAYNYFVSQLKTEGQYNATSFLAMETMSYQEGQPAFAGQNIWEYFVEGISILQAPLVKEVLDRNGIWSYHGFPKCPLFVYKAIHDEVTNVGDTDAYVERECEVGVNILYERNTVGGHLDEDTNGDARAVEWLSAVLDGTYAEKYEIVGCTVRNVTVSVVDTGLRGRR